VRMVRGSCFMVSNFLRMSAPRKLSRAPQGSAADVRSRPDGQVMGGWGRRGPVVLCRAGRGPATRDRGNVGRSRPEEPA